MKVVYFVRHGESEANVNALPIHIDDKDYALTGKGKEQSRFIAQRAKALDFEVLISSPYVRTRDTAAMITDATGHAAEFSDLFIERKVPSEINGTAVDDPAVEKVLEEWVRTFYSGEPRIGDSENFTDIVERARLALDYLLQRPEEKILVVTHGYFLRVVMAVVIFGDELQPAELRRLVAATSTTNTGITMITYDSGIHRHDVDPDRSRWRIRVFNDHSHLG